MRAISDNLATTGGFCRMSSDQITELAVIPAVHRLHESYVASVDPEGVAHQYLAEVQTLAGNSYGLVCLLRQGSTPSSSLVAVTVDGETKAPTQDALGSLCLQNLNGDEKSIDWLTRRLQLPASAGILAVLPEGTRSWSFHIISKQCRAVGVLVLGFRVPENCFEQHQRTVERLSQELLRLVSRREFAVWTASHSHPVDLIGYSQAIQQTELLTKRFAQADCSVLITGETGTGKELVARMLHFYSPRRHCPLVTLNCGAFTSEQLLASELFGHAKGAFTDARASKKGKFELADGGTLFLDEVGTMSATMQVALLRALRYGEIQKVGDERISQKVNVRVVAACNENLEELVERGTFRRDVHSRLGVAHIHVPPLRERREDLPILVSYLLRKVARQVGAPAREITDEVMEILGQAAWPDNIAGLESCLCHASLMSDGRIEREHLPSRLLVRVSPSSDPVCQCEPAPDGFLAEILSRPVPLPLRHARASFEAAYIKNVLEHCSNNNVSRAARLLGISRQGLQKKMQRLLRAS